MKFFPETLHVEFLKNKENLETIKENIITEKLRNEIYNFLIFRKDENEFFDLDKFNNDTFNSFNFGKNETTFQILNDCIMKELNNLGWKCQLSFADTALFIYSTEEKPKSCW
jgi:hypothetical protein